MAKQGNATATPRLRFPEFRRTEEWRRELLGNICEMQAGKFIAAADITEKSADGCYPCFGGNGLRGYTKNFNQTGRHSLIGRQGALCGNVNLVEGEFYATEHAVVTTPKSGTSTDWLFYNLELLNLNRFATGQAQPGLSVDVLERVVCSAPNNEAEQQKIADCLTSLDEVIAAQGRKVEALKTHKRGLMQQLFPRAGETRPRLRFPEFRNAPEWEEVAIGSMGEVITGNTPTTARHDYYGGVRPFVSPADISDLRFVEATKTTLSEAGFAQGRPVRALSVLFVCIGSTIGKVAQNTRECATNQQINAVVASAEFFGDFIYYLLDMESARISRLAGKQAVPIINKTVFSAVKVIAPRFDEQQRIADCLSSLDTQIAAESDKLATLKTHKRGLMQQLFPDPVGADPCVCPHKSVDTA